MPANVLWVMAHREVMKLWSWWFIFTRRETSHKRWSDTRSGLAPGWRAPHHPVKNTWYQWVKHFKQLNQTPWANHPLDVMQLQTAKSPFFILFEIASYVWSVVLWQASSIEQVFRKKITCLHNIRTLFLKAGDTEETNYSRRTEWEGGRWIENGITKATNECWTGPNELPGDWVSCGEKPLGEYRRWRDRRRRRNKYLLPTEKAWGGTRTEAFGPSLICSAPGGRSHLKAHTPTLLEQQQQRRTLRNRS